MRRRIDINEIFIEVYKAYPARMVYRDDIELSNSIILPASALGVLSSMKNFNDSKNPILFRILNIELNISTHCGVAEFTAEEGACYLPSNMFERLCLTEGQQVNIRKFQIKNKEKYNNYFLQRIYLSNNSDDQTYHNIYDI